MIKIGLLGLGTVGSGVYEIIEARKNYFKELFGKEVVISKILVRDIHKKRDTRVSNHLLTSNPHDILFDNEIDIVIEVLGGVNPAYEYICKALTNGKHVVTANKAVIEAYMSELLKLSKDNDKGLLFEASVGGGIPIIKPLVQAIKTNEITKIKGILNGTTNFILTKMCNEGLSFNEALDLAHKFGYAESDPTDDIDGYDAARKISILSSIAYNTSVKLNDVFCRGISFITTFDIKIFKHLNLSVKLVATSVYEDNMYSVSVEPELFNKNSIYGNVNDAFNIVSITGNMVGELKFYGQGAGKMPTANAVVSDIIDIIKGKYEYFSLNESEDVQSMGVKLLSGRYYLRVTPKNKKDTTAIIDMLKDNDLDFNVLINSENLVCIIEEVSAERMNQLVESMLSMWGNVCYIRLDKDVVELTHTGELMEVAISKF